MKTRYFVMVSVQGAGSERERFWAWRDDWQFPWYVIRSEDSDEWQFQTSVTLLFQLEEFVYEGRFLEVLEPPYRFKGEFP